MAVSLVVNGIPYSFPQVGDPPPHGEQVLDWATAVTDVLSSLSSPTDILNREFTIQNNQSTTQNIVGMVFDTDVTRSAVVEYTIYRTSSTTTAPKAETGTLFLSFDGTSWDMSREASADTGVTLTVTSAGQIKYSSTDIGVVGYIGLISYRARTFTQ